MHGGELDQVDVTAACRRRSGSAGKVPSAEGFNLVVVGHLYVDAPCSFGGARTRACELAGRACALASIWQCMHGYVCEHVLGCRVAGQLSGSTQLFGVVGPAASCNGGSVPDLNVKRRPRHRAALRCLRSDGGVGSVPGLNVKCRPHHRVDTGLECEASVMPPAMPPSSASLLLGLLLDAGSRPLLMADGEPEDERRAAAGLVADLGGALEDDGGEAAAGVV